MSEFSEVYFLKSNDQNDAVCLIKEAGLRGYVCPERDGWVAFVANTDPAFHLSQQLVEKNKGVLLHFVNAEDHGWEFKVCFKKELACSFFCGVDEEMESGEPFQIGRKIEKEVFEEMIKQSDGNWDVLRKYMDDSAPMEETLDAAKFTSDMQLYFSEWISYHYVQKENGEFGKYGEYENLKFLEVGI